MNRFASEGRSSPEDLSTPTPGKSPRKFLISLSVTLIILFALFWKVDLERIGAAIRLADPALLALALSIGLVVHIFMGAGMWWRIVLSLGHRLPYRDALFARVGSDPIRFVMPFKAGEIMKAIYLKKRLGLPLDRAMGSVVFEKFLNIFGLFVLFLAASAFSRHIPGSEFAIGVILGATVLLESARAREAGYHLAEKIHPELRKVASELLAVFEEVPLKKKIFLWCYAVVYQVRQPLCCWLLFVSMGIEVPPAELAVRATLAFFIAAAPVTIGGIGVREVSIMALFSPFADRETLLLIGLLMSVTVYILPSLVGLTIMPRFLGYVSETKAPENSNGSPVSAGAGN